MGWIHLEPEGKAALRAAVKVASEESEQSGQLGSGAGGALINSLLKPFMGASWKAGPLVNSGQSWAP